MNGIISDFPFDIYVKEVCRHWDTRYNVVNVVKNEWSNLPLATGSVKVMSKTLQVRLSLHVCKESVKLH